MSNDLAVEVKNVSMKFNMSSERIDSLKEYVVKFFTKKLFFQEFWALRSLSFSIKKGEVFGIIGLNGAGKSTILKVVAGVLKPTNGQVLINGKIAPLIELGAGFDLDLTGRENIYLNGAVLGYSKRFMDQKFQDIVEFSELRVFLDSPLKNYSSGMVARIGFAIATIVDPEILIVDEILAVGDSKFQKKCEKKIQSMIESGTTVIIVSHDINQIEKLCNRVMWLEHGKIKVIGETKGVCKKYKES